MKNFLIGLLFSLCVTLLVGLTTPTYADPAGEFVEIPQNYRQKNYDPYGEGSCVHASTATVLRQNGYYKEAEEWLSNYHSGETAFGLIWKLEDSGLPYSYTYSGNVEFLEWAVRNRHCAGIFYFRRHAVNLVGLDESHAYLLDNNYPESIIKIPRETFIYNWQNLYGGFAWTIIGKPSPPYPKQ